MALDEVLRHFVAKITRSHRHLIHQRSNFPSKSRISQNLVGRDASGANGEAVERYVPDQFLPTCRREAVDRTAVHTRLLKKMRQLPRTPGGRPPKFAESDGTRSMVAGQFTRSLPCHRNKAQPTQHALSPNERGNELLVTQAILQGNNRCLRSDQRGKQRGKGIVACGLKRNDHEINPADLRRRRKGIHPLKSPGGVAFAQNKAMRPHVREIAAHEKAHLGTGQCETGSIIASYGTGANDGNFAKVRSHRETNVKIQLDLEYKLALEPENRPLAQERFVKPAVHRNDLAGRLRKPL